MSKGTALPFNDPDVLAFARAIAASRRGEHDEAERLFIVASDPRFGHRLDCAFVDEAVEKLITPDDKRRILVREPATPGFLKSTPARKRRKKAA